MGKSSPPLLASLANSGQTGLTKDTWVLIVSEGDHIILEKLFSQKCLTKRMRMVWKRLLQDCRWEQFTESKLYKPVKINDFGSGGEALWTAVAHCGSNKFRDG